MKTHKLNNWLVVVDSEDSGWIYQWYRTENGMVYTSGYDADSDYDLEFVSIHQDGNIEYHGEIIHAE